MFVNIAVDVGRLSTDASFKWSDVFLVNIYFSKSWAACGNFGGDVQVCQPRPPGGGGVGRDHGEEEEEETEEDKEARRERQMEREMEKAIERAACNESIDQLIEECKSAYTRINFLGGSFCAAPAVSAVIGWKGVAICEGTMVELTIKANAWCTEQGAATRSRECN